MNVESGAGTPGQEGKEIIPSATIRPHHFSLPFIRSAFIGRGSPKELSHAEVERAKIDRPFNHNPRGYKRDVIGGTKAEVESYQNGLETYLTQLRDLPDDSFVEIDIKPDGVCNSCAIGNHCKTSGQSINDPVGCVKTEEYYIDNIRRKLKISRAELGKDFFEKQTNHTLYDLQGKPFKDLEKSPQVKVVFNSLIVNTGVLRKIA